MITTLAIKKMKLVHACGPYGNDCGGVVERPKSMKTTSLALPTLPKSLHYTAALEAEANST